MGGGRVDLKIIFFGTPDYVLPILKLLAKHHEIVAVVTQPPKPVGRDQFITYSPVDVWAYKRRVPVFCDFNKPLPEAEMGVLAAYGKIIPPKIIGGFKFGILNIHPSLLPKYRGASPIQSVIMAGDNKTGVTIIRLDEKMDHGPIITQFKEEIAPNDTNESLCQRLFERSAEVLIQLIPAYISGKITPKIQDEAQATFTKILHKEDGFIDLSKSSPAEAERFIRAMTPWPGAWTYINPEHKRLKLLKAHLDGEKLILDEVQLEGKNPVAWKQFKEAYPKIKII